MGDPRLSYIFQGIDEVYATFQADNSTIVYDQTKDGGSTAVGLAVTLSAAKTVALCADGDAVIGRLDTVEYDGSCRVQIGGGTTLPGGASATLTLGAKIVGALGASSAKGYIRSAASGTATELVKMDHEIYDATDPTNVVVMLS